MHRMLTAVLFVLIVGTMAFAQPFPDTLWTRSYSAEQFCSGVYGIAGTDHGGFVLSGWMLPHGIVAFDSAGNTTDRQFLTHVNPLCLLQTPDSGYFVAGSSAYLGFPHRLCPAAALINSSGDTVWRYIATDGIRDNEFHSAYPTADGGYVLAGVYSVDDYPWLSTFVVKLNAAGVAEWSTYLHHATGWETLAWVYQTLDGQYVLLDNYWDGNSDITAFYKLGQNGDSLSVVSYNTIHPLCKPIVWPENGTVVIASKMHDSTIVTYFDENSDLFFSRAIYLGPNVSVFNMQETRDGGYLFGAYDTNYDLVLAKTTASLDLVWEHTYDTRTLTDARCLAVLDDGGYLFAGDAPGDGIPCDTVVYVVRIAPDTIAYNAINPSNILHPSSFTLSAYPNPFNPQTTLSFTLPQQGNVKLDIFDVNGRKVKELTDEVLSAGEHHVTFDGSSLPSGIYFARMNFAGTTQTQKLLLLK
jgi:hypothetical protein